MADTYLTCLLVIVAISPIVWIITGWIVLQNNYFKDYDKHTLKFDKDEPQDPCEDWQAMKEQAENIGKGEDR
jgi:hypothetical protein